ncbi:hypothetical protein [Bacillus thuringiensis]|nr:hypothetical protein [Bacillus thuringiensis]
MFYCFKIQSKKTKIIGDAEGRMQICETCHKELFSWLICEKASQMLEF